VARIFAFLSREPSEIEHILIQKLRLEHEVSRLDVTPGSEWRVSIKDAIAKSDVILTIVTERYANSKYGLDELKYLVGYVESSSNKILIPVVIGDIDVPFDITRYNYIKLEPRDIASIDKTVELINSSIWLHAGKVQAIEEKQIEKKEKIERKASEYVEDAITELNRRETELLKRANLWYRLGYGAIVVGVIAAGFFTFIGYQRFSSAQPAWDLVVFTAIKSIVLVGLLLAMAKYSFTLAKSFMEESLKNADRIHAISFGKFYLQAFEESIAAGDVKEIFQHWNINSKNSFSGQTSEIIEPKILEAALEIVKVISKQGDKKP